MKKIFILLLLIGGILLGLNLGKSFLDLKSKPALEPNKVPPSTKKIEEKIEASKSIFIPYWSLSEASLDISEYDRLIYFGIAPTFDGINQQEAGYEAIQTFLEMSKDKEKYLTLRMIDEEINSNVLENRDRQKKIIAAVIEILKEFEFDGVVLDLEISNFLNQDIREQINDFVQLFYTEASNNYRKFLMTIYGDSIYRGRPFDLSFIARNSDEIMVMAYDFHKSRGEPGPNFPFDSGAKYGYDFKVMVEDFLQFAPKEKLSVVFGMFGYDWLVDEKKRPIRQAEALSLNEIKNKFIDKCEFKNCVIKRDKISQETEINYIISAPTPDEQDIYRIDYHVVWLEDEESVRMKTKYLHEQGIESTAYWAYGYF